MLKSFLLQAAAAVLGTLVAAFIIFSILDALDQEATMSAQEAERRRRIMMDVIDEHNRMLLERERRLLEEAGVKR